jgi:hypothetical protein
VGPIPVNDDNLGKEVVSDFESSLFSGKPGANEFFTDANGREFQKRILNYRPTWSLEVNEPIAGNYYPVTTGMYLRDEKAGLQLSVLGDRAQAAASLRPGELEFMVHRRLLADDNRGVNEALNETTGQQAVVGKRRLARRSAVELERGLALAREVHHRGRRRLHAERELEALDAALERGIGAVVHRVLLVERLEEVELLALHVDG